MSSSFDGYSAIASGFATGISANGYGFQASSSPDGGISFSFDPSNNGGYGYGAHVFVQNPTPYGKAHSGIPGGGNYKSRPTYQHPKGVPHIVDPFETISYAEMRKREVEAIRAWDYATNPYRRRKRMLTIIAFFPITLPMLAIEHAYKHIKNAPSHYPPMGSSRPGSENQHAKLTTPNRPF